MVPIAFILVTLTTSSVFAGLSVAVSGGLLVDLEKSK